MLTQLAAVAERTGFPVSEVPGWKTRGTTDSRGRLEDMLGVDGVTCHHTANGGAPGDAPSLNVVRRGRADLEGPLAHYVLGASGRIYVVAAGRCNHAGESLAETFGNPHRIGIEAEARGTPGAAGDWPDVQMRAYRRLCLELAWEFDFPFGEILGHKETCKPIGRKSDPSFSMSTFRADVARLAEELTTMQPNTVIAYTKLAAERLKKTSDPFSTVVQWPPAVRIARDEIAAGREENATALAEIRTELARLADAVTKLAAGTDPKP